MSDVSDASKLTTAEALAAMEAELAQLEGEGRREIAARIKTAREWGDLKENSEYHDAKNEQAHLETKIARLRGKITGAVVVEGRGEAGKVSLGSSVLVRDENGVEETWTLVSSHEAAPSEGRVSASSPLGSALLGRAAGDQTTAKLPSRTRTLTVVRVA